MSPAESFPDANGMLSSLLGRLEAALAEVRESSQGHPLFEVEAELSGKLDRALPGVRFAAEDIRNWSAQISSQHPHGGGYGPTVHLSSGTP